jgi:hypothetical protein
MTVSNEKPRSRFRLWGSSRTYMYILNLARAAGPQELRLATETRPGTLERSTQLSATSRVSSGLHLLPVSIRLDHLLSQ